MTMTREPIKNGCQMQNCDNFFVILFWRSNITKFMVLFVSSVCRNKIIKYRFRFKWFVFFCMCVCEHTCVLLTHNHKFPLFNCRTSQVSWKLAGKFRKIWEDIQLISWRYFACLAIVDAWSYIFTHYKDLVAGYANGKWWSL